MNSGNKKLSILRTERFINHSFKKFFTPRQAFSSLCLAAPAVFGSSFLRYHNFMSVSTVFSFFCKISEAAVIIRIPLAWTDTERLFPAAPTKSFCTYFTVTLQVFFTFPAMIVICAVPLAAFFAVRSPLLVTDTFFTSELA